MTNSSASRRDRFRLALDDGSVVEVDGSTLPDPVSGVEPAAVLVRLPGERAGDLARALAGWSAAVELADGSGREERSLSWALRAAAGVAGWPSLVEPDGMVSSGRRALAAQVLKERQDFDLPALIAVVDAAAWWISQPSGGEYAAALLGAVADEMSAGAAFEALTSG